MNGKINYGGLYLYIKISHKYFEDQLNDKETYRIIYSQLCKKKICYLRMIDAKKTLYAINEKNKR